MHIFTLSSADKMDNRLTDSHTDGERARKADSYTSPKHRYNGYKKCDLNKLTYLRGY